MSSPPLRSISRLEATFMHAANLFVGGTGLVYGWMLYFAESEDEFAIVNHPWQPELHGAHILVAPLLVFAGGILWSGHAVAGLRQKGRRRKKSGLALLFSLWPMIASGYLLQVTVGETWQRVWVWMHVVSSVLWLLAMLGHLFLAGSRRAGGERLGA